MASQIDAGLLERDGELQLLEHVAEEAAAGTGAIVLVFGEAGIGKSSLLEAWLAGTADTCHVLRGACDDLATQRPLGALRELRDAAPAIADAVADGDAISVAEAILEELSHPLRTTVLAVDDLHWADDTTLDVIRYVGRRIGTRPGILLLTYRDDEVDPPHPLHSVLGTFLGDRTFRLALQALSLEAVATLVGPDRGLDPRQVARVTGGNPFFVTEVLADGTDQVPASVTASVLGRMTQLPRQTRDALALLATEPSAIETGLLAELVPDTRATLAPAEERGLFRSDDRGRLRFQHELVRRAILDNLAPALRALLHRQMLTVLREHGVKDTARILHHAARGDALDVITELAPAAAREAVAEAAYRQAATYEELALRHEEALDPDIRASLWEQHAWSLHYLGRAREAAAAAARALELRTGSDDLAATLKALCILATMRFMAGDAEGGAADYERAVELAADVTDATAQAEFAVLRLTVQHLRGEHAHVLANGPATIERAARAGQSSLVVLGHIYHAGSRVTVGDDGGLDELAAALDEHDDLPRWTIARAHLRLVSYLVLARRWDELGDRLQVALGLFEDHGFSFHRHTALGHLAWAHLERGDWSRAREVLQPLLHDAGQAPGAAASAVPTHAAALLAARTGDDRAEERVRTVWDQGRRSRTQEMLVRGATGLLEWGWLVEDDRVVDATMEPALAAAAGTVEHERVLWHLALHGVRPKVPARGQGPEALSLAGDWQAAAAAWGELGMPYHQAVELTNSGDLDASREGLERLIELDARGAVPVARRRLRELGASNVPYGPQARTRENPAGLTPRQLEVLELLAEGITNSEIAERLVISVRTVDHHVSAILQKMDVADREAAAALAAELKVI